MTGLVTHSVPGGILYDEMVNFDYVAVTLISVFNEKRKLCDV